MAIILLLSGTLLSVRSSFVAIDFLQNQESIAANLCENIDKPELNCEGRCYLKKRMNALLADMKADKTEESRLSEISFMFYFFVENQEIEQLHIAPTGLLNSFHNQHLSKVDLRIQTPPPQFL